MVETVEDRYSDPTEQETGFPVKIVEVAGDKGPCGGVNMAIETTFKVLEIVDRREPVYANNHPVHNELISAEFAKQGLIIQPDINHIPDGSILIASAHGWPPTDKAIAESKKLLVIDTTCQLVTKVGRAADRAVSEGKHVLYVGAANHPEPRGILGRLPNGSFTFIDVDGGNPTLPPHIARDFVTLSQTTLSTKGIQEKVDELREANPGLVISSPSGICYATDNRQKAVRDRLFQQDETPINALIVVGSRKSHNSNELRNVGKFERGIPSYLIDKPEDIDMLWFNNGVERILVTSGASVLDRYLQDVLRFFTDRGSSLRLLPRTEKDLTFVGPDLDQPLQRYQTEQIQ